MDVPPTKMKAVKTSRFRAEQQELSFGYLIFESMSMGLDSGEISTRDVTLGATCQYLFKIDLLESHQRVSGGRIVVKSNA